MTYDLCGCSGAGAVNVAAMLLRSDRACAGRPHCHWGRLGFARRGELTVVVLFFVSPLAISSRPLTPFSGLSCARSLPYLITRWVPGGTILASISAVLLVLVAISMYLTATGDPGILPRSPEVPDEILRNPAHPRERIVYVDQTPITTKYCGTLAGSAVLPTAFGVELLSRGRRVNYRRSGRRSLGCSTGDAVRAVCVPNPGLWSSVLLRRLFC